MVNFNGDLVSKDTNFFNHENRAFRYGDALFETLRVVNGHIYFLEDHYLRLMASMRILRMEIPMHFTMEFFSAEILKTVQSQKTALVDFYVFRNNGGDYLPMTLEVSYVIVPQALDQPFFMHRANPYLVELYKDFYKPKDLLATLNTTNKLIQVTGSIFAKENGYDDCLLINDAKAVVESLGSNLFLVSKNTVKTPPLSDGCTNGILRKKLLEILKKQEGVTITETPISPFELQKADELFLTHIAYGIQSISKYRKKEFSTEMAQNLVGKLNAVARLAN
jgi:branched-chain amino acid aminotransferase